jgi:tetratricopeptide (TPR) repeat protein
MEDRDLGRVDKAFRLQSANDVCGPRDRGLGSYPLSHSRFNQRGFNLAPGVDDDCARRPWRWASTVHSVVPRMRCEQPTVRLLQRRARIASDPGDSRALYLGASLLQHLGREAEALEWSNRAIELDPNESATFYNLACFHAVGGRKEEAIAMLERAASLGWNRSAWARHDSDLESLRGDPRFERLLERMEAAETASAQ